ncbi:Queuine tRNA-ribosyltransferase accessory subunit [Drechslerella dactyloides]|uniref:Queuine tRNA-ribosyltransferase accessory subunit 2 n=1 Tax=Drechslerella dactyloides TaxID=74499 RepID=A0AAD6ITG9_DREDA|nr:Queuine tRNA-ribosyltransferase accessory subunit [Drechslerella dactyloides]
MFVFRTISRTSTTTTRRPSMNTFRVLKTAVTDVATTQPGARIGVLQLSKGFTVHTPNFVAPTSRGVVPHLSPDNLDRNTGVVGVYVALEDFIEKAPQRVPPLYTWPGSLRDFISLPADNLLILAPRRSPAIACPKPNSDANVSILTSVGFRDLPVKDYVSAVVKLQPDIVVGVADVPNTETPGKTRVPKIPARTERWLDELVGRINAGVSAKENADTHAAKAAADHRPAVFAPALALDHTKQRLYIDYLVDNVEKLCGLVFTQTDYLVDLPGELQQLARFNTDVTSGPHEILDLIDRGVDMFNVNFTGLATDAGIALHFTFGGDSSAEGVLLEQMDLATDMWNDEFATDLSPLEDGCACYACRKHHKAYIQHCLAAKEMTAWVLLQLHNLNVVERFFTAVRESIEQGRWEGDKEAFEQRYKRELPEKTGKGPRLRGYQYKSAGGDKKLNDPAYRSLDADTPEDEEGVPQTDAAGLQKSGFAQVASDW